MKILRKGAYKRTFIKECDTCHTVLELDPQDITIDGTPYCGSKIFTICPICKKEIKLKLDELP